MNARKPFSDSFATTPKPGFPCQHLYQRGREAGWQVCRWCGARKMEKVRTARVEDSLARLREIGSDD